MKDFMNNKRFLVSTLVVIIVVIGGVFLKTSFSGNGDSEKVKVVSNSKGNQYKGEKIRVPKVNDYTQPEMTASQKKIAKTIDPVVKKYRLNGTVLFVKNGKVLYNRGYGYSNFEKKTINTARTQYQILSVQKSMTTQMLLQLVQKKKVSLDDPISKFYPTIPNGQNIRIRNLLTMSSGLVLTQKVEGTPSPENVVKWYVAHVRDNGQLGMWHYFGPNFSLIAGIVMKYDKRSYEELYKQMFIKELDLKETGFITDHNAVPYMSASYNETNNVKNLFAKPFVESPINTHFELGTADVAMSARDFYTALSAILNNKYVSAKTNQQLRSLALPSSGYAGGMYEDVDRYIMRGQGYGQSCVVNMSKNGKDAVVYMSNFTVNKKFGGYNALRRIVAGFYNEMENGRIS